MLKNFSILKYFFFAHNALPCVCMRFCINVFVKQYFAMENVICTQALAKTFKFKKKLMNTFNFNGMGLNKCMRHRNLSSVNSYNNYA